MSDKDTYKKSAFEQFNRAMGEQTDPIMVVLRSHLYSENLLENLIATLLPRGDKLNEGGSLSYNQKLAVVESIDVLSDRVKLGTDHGFLSACRPLPAVFGKFVVCPEEMGRVESRLP